MMDTNTPKKYSQSQKILEAKEPMAAYATPGFGTFVMRDGYSLVKKSREGVTTDVFYRFADRVRLPEKKLAMLLNLSPRTISNYREQHKSLEANYSEHLLKLIALFEAGKEYLGSYEEFKSWLERPFWDSQEHPQDFLNTSGGVDLVMERLERLAQGYPV